MKKETAKCQEAQRHVARRLIAVLWEEAERNPSLLAGLTKTCGKKVLKEAKAVSKAIAKASSATVTTAKQKVFSGLGVGPLK